MSPVEATVCLLSARRSRSRYTPPSCVTPGCMQVDTHTHTHTRSECRMWCDEVLLSYSHSRPLIWRLIIFSFQKFITDAGNCRRQEEVDSRGFQLLIWCVTEDFLRLPSSASDDSLILSFSHLTLRLEDKTRGKHPGLPWRSVCIICWLITIEFLFHLDLIFLQMHFELCFVLFIFQCVGEPNNTTK